MKQSEQVWLFNITLEKEDGSKFDSNYPEELLNIIVNWAEQNQLQIGGGYRAPTHEEMQDGPVF
jgi:hypothetical protein